MPADENFCLITFTLLPSPFLNATSLEKRNAAVWTYDTPPPLGNGANGATTFVAPRLDRPKSWYDKLGNSPLDVTDHLYIGARPGHNKQAEIPHLGPHTRHTPDRSSRHRPSLDGRAKMPTYPQLSSSHTSATSQDMMPPFDQLGFEHSPAEFFDASTASYAPDVAASSPPPPPPATRISISAANDTQKAQFNKAVLRMKATPSPWASGFTKAGQPVPRRWHNLSWWDTLVAIHISGGPDNPYAHIGPAFPMWHRLFLRVLELGLNDVMGNPTEPITQNYWDWTNPLQSARLWASIGGDGFGQCVPDGPFAHANGGWNISLSTSWIGPIDGPAAQPNCIVREFATNGLVALPSSNNVERSQQIPTYDSWPFDQNALGSISFRQVLEGWGGPDNQGEAIGSSYRGMHNMVHIWVGGTMTDIASPNDPTFFFHHANVDQLYQRWLEHSGQVYAGEENGGKPSAADYPAALAPLVNAACKAKFPHYRVYLRNVDGVMTLEVSPDGKSLGCGASCLQSINGAAGWNDDALTDARAFLISCVTGTEGPPAQLLTSFAQALHFVLAWPEGTPNAASIPPVNEQFLDPTVFKANLELARDPTTIVPHTYESFTFAGAFSPRVGGISSNSSVFLIEPTMYNRETQIGLAQPLWLSRLNVMQPQEPDKVRMVAIAVDPSGFKLNLKSWTPSHYWGPGYVDQLIDSNSAMFL